MKTTKIVVATLIAILSSTLVAYAIIDSLNGQTGATQKFSNDTNVTISSASDTHSLVWSGQLPINRGGTGNDAFRRGSVIFMGNTQFRQDNDNFFWDNINDRLGIRTNEPLDSLHIASGGVILGGPATTTIGASGVTINATVGAPISWGPDGVSYVSGGDADGDGFSDEIEIAAGHSTTTLRLFNQDTSRAAVLDVSLIDDSDKTFTFPNQSGTIALLQGSQTFVGLNRFEQEASTTIYLGSTAKSGCLVIGDSDGSGVTYITANNGVLFATSTKPSICQ